MKTKPILLCAIVASLSCASTSVQQKDPAPVRFDGARGVVAVAVIDERPVAIHSRKGPAYVGVIRSENGIPGKRFTPDEVPLADAMNQDISRMLNAAGYGVSDSQSAPRQVEATIWSYEFDGRTYFKLPYDISLRVTNAKGVVLHEQELQDTLEFDIGWRGNRGLKEAYPGVQLQVTAHVVDVSTEILEAFALAE